jgi:hypothetical protein
MTEIRPCGLTAGSELELYFSIVGMEEFVISEFIIAFCNQQV